ncbi:MAG: hypothetical protein MK183_03545 [Verrucomicrobiales bacterium]|nr:hypothetical protein [Verrucomicrobiales bacterium]
MDDDDFNSEFLGSLQRHANLKQNQKTQQEIAGMREDLRRKEAAEAAAPKCPYCAGAISYDVIKCRHCTSDVQWCEVEGNAYVLKAEDNAQLFVQQMLHEQAWKKQQRAEAEQIKIAERVQAEENAAELARSPEATRNWSICSVIGVLIMFWLGGCYINHPYFDPIDPGSTTYSVHDPPHWIWFFIFLALAFTVWMLAKAYKSCKLRKAHAEKEALEAYRAAQKRP